MVGNGVPFESRGAVAATSGFPHTHRAGMATTSRTGRPSWRLRVSRSSAVGTSPGVGPGVVGVSVTVVTVLRRFGAAHDGACPPRALGSAEGLARQSVAARTSESQKPSAHGLSPPLTVMGPLPAVPAGAAPLWPKTQYEVSPGITMLMRSRACCLT